MPARQQMAVSLGWHIVLACFGVAFPTIIFVMHRRGIVRDDPVALGLAKRWAKVSAVLFAIGAVSGTVLDDLRAYASVVERVEGKDRYHVSAAIARMLEALRRWMDTFGPQRESETTVLLGSGGDESTILGGGGLVLSTLLGVSA